MSGNINTQEFSISDYDAAVELWQQVEGLEIAEGDDRQSVAQFLAHTRRPARWPRWVVRRFSLESKIRRSQCKPWFGRGALRIRASSRSLGSTSGFHRSR